MGLVDPEIHPVVISLVTECISGITILRSGQNSHTGSLACEVRALMERPVEAIEVASARANSESR